MVWSWPEKRWILVGATLMISLTGGCASDAEGEDQITYHGEIAPLLARSCNQCHQPGGGGPFDLTTPEAARLYADSSLAAIESGRMPPWPADSACRSFMNERLLTEADKELFRTWVDTGTPLGTRPPGESTPTVLGQVSFEATHVLSALEPYIPDGMVNDDYRCLPMNLELDRDLYITASQVHPGANDLVHHVLIYAVSPSHVDDLEAMDAAHPGPGYSCFGDSDVGIPQPVGAWVPGMPPIVMEDNVAIQVEKGSRFVMQIHYNMLWGDPEPDWTEWHVRFTEEEPEWLVDSRPFAHRTLEIPAGDAQSVQERVFKNRTNEPWIVASVSPHMHLLGKSIRAEVFRAEGENTCLVDIPRWDFNWQQPYRIPKEQWLEIAPGDEIHLRCEYDNSPGNQPLMNGQTAPPKDVFWGDGTLDEMCLVYLSTIRPFEAPKRMCESFSDCWTTCRQDGTSSLACLTGCMGEDFDCALCLIPETFVDGGCLDVPCTEEMESMDGCLMECATQTVGEGGNVDVCMQELCPVARDNLDACASPTIASGSCDSVFVSCDANL